MVSISNYGEREINACKSVLLELVHLMGEFKDDMVLIGGWIPSFLFPESDNPHVGSLDIDIALNFSKIHEATTATNYNLVEQKGIEPSTSTLRTWRSPS